METKIIYGVTTSTEKISPPSQSYALIEADDEEDAVGRIQRVNDGTSEYDVFVYSDTDVNRDGDIVWSKRLKTVPFDKINCPIEMYEQISYQEGKR